LNSNSIENSTIGLKFNSIELNSIKDNQYPSSYRRYSKSSCECCVGKKNLKNREI
jgi:hypothetical protein